MKQIEPVQIWKGGEQFEAIYLNASIVNDNLETACTFYYSLNSGGQGTEAMPVIIGQSLAEGNVTLDGENYLAWSGHNNDAYSYIAEKLNLTLVSE